MRKILLLALLISGCATSVNTHKNRSQTGAVEDVSIVALISNPASYDGKAVRVIGALRLQFEGDAVCLHADDLRNGIRKNCLWVSLDLQKLEVTYAEISKLNGNYVLIEGAFNAANKGHFDMYSGSIDEIWRVTNWSRASR